MTNPTSNFGWQMPTSTDLVTDLPADFEVFGQAVDTSLADLKGGTTGQVLAKATGTDMDFTWTTPTSGMTNPMTTTGDTIYSSSGSTPARLGIGSTGQVLTVAGGVPTWATATSGGTGGYTLLNAGGTALTGAATITVSSITSNDLLIYVYGASCGTGNSAFRIKFNSSATNHNNSGARFKGDSSWAASNLDNQNESNAAGALFAYGSSTASRPTYGTMFVQACTSTGVKPYWYSGANDGGAGSGQWSIVSGGYFDAAAAITSVSLVSSAGNFNGGTLYIYGRA